MVSAEDMDADEYLKQQQARLEEERTAIMANKNIIAEVGTTLLWKYAVEPTSYLFRKSKKYLPISKNEQFNWQNNAKHNKRCRQKYWLWRVSC
jgi:hypothetical protein